MYYFKVFDPRPVPAATTTNDEIFALGPVLGVEVTVPALAERCELGNIDPQHTGGDPDTAAIEAALEWSLPPNGAVLATVRADLDSVGAMAVLAMRAKGQFPMFLEDEILGDEELSLRIEAVAAADKSKSEKWQGPRPLPTPEEPWGGSLQEKPLAAIAACVADFRRPLSERVEAMRRWLLTGQEPEEYRQRVERERAEMVAALQSGAIKVREAAGGRIVVVESTHRAATGVGYHLAPVVVALNPQFRFGGGEPHRKFTICQFTTGYVDLRAALQELSELEEGWGGSPTIGGSPQGVSSRLSTDEVVKVVERHLLR